MNLVGVWLISFLALYLLLGLAGQDWFTCMAVGFTGGFCCMAVYAILESVIGPLD